MKAMKIIKEEKKIRGVTLRLDESVMEKIDQVAVENEISRQKLIEAILEQVLADKTFVLRVKK